jgi:hypothetical protein
MKHVKQKFEASLGDFPGASELAIALLPKQLAISSSHRHGLKYSVQLKRNLLTYTYWPEQDSCSHKPRPKRRQIKPSAKQWQAFRKTLDRLNVWCWQNYYPSPPDFGGSTSWRLEIAYADKAIKTGGDNSFPLRNGKPSYVFDTNKDATFAKFYRAVAALVGREFGASFDSPPLRTEFNHILFGKITYDSGTGLVTVEHPNVKERLSWLMAPEQADLPIWRGYYPDKFEKAMQETGLMFGVTDSKTLGKENIPEGAPM